RSVHDDAATVLAHPAEHGLGAAERALQVYLQDLVPGGFSCLGKGLVEQDASIVDQDVGAAEMPDRIIEHRLAAGHGRNISAIGNRPATLRLDRLHHLLRARNIGTAAVPWTAEVVDDDSSTL